MSENLNYTCPICLENVDSTKKLLCSEDNHDVCSGCLSDQMSLWSIDKPNKIISFFDEHKTFPCIIDSKCKGHYSTSSIIETGCQKLLTSQLELSMLFQSDILNNKFQQKEQQEKQQKEKKEQLSKNDSQYDSTIKQIRVLLSEACKCPKCSTPFIDFSGCAALNCTSCGTNFCAYCLKETKGSNDECHKHVKDCLSPYKNRYYVHSEYFVTEQGWEILKEDHKTNSVQQYIETLDKKFLLEYSQQLIEILKGEKLLSPSSISYIAEIIYSHSVRDVHLIKLPLLYAKLLAAKTDRTVECCISEYPLPHQLKLDLGRHVKQQVQKEHPEWVSQKCKVPGKHYAAINYPPRFMELIASIIEQWGYQNGCWQ